MNFPSSTYRVQLNNKFTFKDLKQIIGYLHKLGISTIYAAPITTSVSGSSHGYDVTDASTINPEIGTLEELKAIADDLKQRNMTWLQDIVPNHMAFSDHNYRLTDVMERGQFSPFHSYFDIDWDHHNPANNGKILVPFLGNDFSSCLEAGEIKILFDERGFNFSYYDHLYPLSISAYRVLMPIMGNFITSENFENELNTYIDKSQTLNLDDWLYYKEEFIFYIWNSIDKKLSILQAIDKINDNKNLINDLLQNQYYLLTSWKTSSKEMNYRRFFTVNSLICLKMEDESVFAEYHHLFTDLYNNNIIQGVRIDHIDGLYHPQQYVERLRNLLGKECYIIAEKILDYNEDIAKDWPLQGTSGYEFLSFVNRLLTGAEGAEKLRSFYQQLVPEAKSYADILFENKYNFLNSQMCGELDNLMLYLEGLGLLHETLLKAEAVKKALGILMAAFPVYRIYPAHFPLSDESMQLVNKAFDKAFQKAPELTNELNWLKQLFVERLPENDVQAEHAQNKLKFIMRLMQFTGPLAAKGVEDTTFYVYNPLISHNEVGDSPEQLSITTDDFHQKMLSRKRNNPYSLNATSTHDTKRGEDARMRINILAEMADEWIALVKEWNNVAKPAVQQVNGKKAPSLNDAYFIYQSLIGSFPEDLKVTDEFLSRSKEFIVKALREAKTETNYHQPNEEYENACINFIRVILKVDHSFYKSFVPFLEKVLLRASIYSLVQTVIKITAPGIPDIYQGSELWELSYVDPDNRRPVNYLLRQQLLDEIITRHKESTEAALSYCLEQREKGAEKLYITWQMLNLRNTWNDLFLHGDYTPLKVTNGDKKAVAYARNYRQDWILIVLPLGIDPTNIISSHWQNLSLELPEIAPQQWRNHFTNELLNGNQIQLSNLFSKLPVAILKSAT